MSSHVSVLIKVEKTTVGKKTKRSGSQYLNYHLIKLLIVFVHACHRFGSTFEVGQGSVIGGACIRLVSPCAPMGCFDAGNTEKENSTPLIEFIEVVSMIAL